MTDDRKDTHHDLIVIGAGPGGYVAALRAAQLGMDVLCVDENEQLGGTCNRIGCIPSKVLLESSHRFELTRDGLGKHGIEVDGVTLNLETLMKRKNKVVESLSRGVASLFKGKGVQFQRGRARFAEGPKVLIETEGDTLERTADAVLVATGSRPVALPDVPFDGERVGSSSDALSYGEVPEHLVVVGAGAIGLELGSVWRRLGARVTVVEIENRILPGVDAEIAGKAQELFEKQGLVFELESRVASVTTSEEACTVERVEKDPLDCDRVLVAIGRKPNTEGLGLDTVGIETDEKGRIPVDETYQTERNDIYAIGDVIQGPMLAHRAEEDGIACVERLATGVGHPVDHDLVPGVVYTDPEIAYVGKTEEELTDAEIPYEKGVFAFRANGRARTLDQTEGRVKILAHAETDRVLGVHILGPRAGDLIAEATAAMTYGASSEDIARTVHAHPTLPEALKEAALAVSDRALHA